MILFPYLVGSFVDWNDKSFVAPQRGLRPPLDRSRRRGRAIRIQWCYLSKYI